MIMILGRKFARRWAPLTVPPTPIEAADEVIE